MVTCFTPLTAGDLRRRLSFLLGDRAQQEHFAIFGGDLHVGRFHRIAGEQLRTHLGGDPVSEDAVLRLTGVP